MMYKYSIRLAAKFFLRSMAHIKRPPNYWRTLEYKYVLSEGEFAESDVILDIGSPKDLSLYLSKIVGARVYTTDINDYFIRNLEFLRIFEGLPSDKLNMSIEDGRCLTYKDRFFTKVYSISVLEHIPDSGDTECIKEISRVLADGGKCILSVPFSPESKVDYKEEDDFYWAEQSIKADNGRAFYQRRYSEQDLYERLINPSGLVLEKLQYVGEKILSRSDNELIDYLPKWTSPIEPILSNLLLSKPVNEWSTLKKPLCALIVLKKQSH